MNLAPQWLDLAAAEELKAQQRLVCRLPDGLEVLLLEHEGQPLALSNRCPHQGRPLDRGRILHGSISCPFHGACFDLRSGQALKGPGGGALHRFESRVEQGRIFVDVSRRPADLPPWALPRI